ncbi:MAG: SMP-30/gluconolactonase/LRE family protein [Leadbetterella sp.]
MDYSVKVELEIPSLLGEGPIWHPVQKVLFFVDILLNQIHRFDPKTKNHVVYQLQKMPAAIVPTLIENILLVSLEDGIATFNTDTEELVYVQRFHEQMPSLRANDGKCDPWGNFWVGTMSKTCEENAGALYRFGFDGAFSTVFSDCTISNGLAWDRDKGYMYYIDSIKDSIRRYDVSEDGILIGNETTIVHKPSMRYFDGMTIDKEGKLWVAHCTDSCIRRWDPETGEELLKIEMPVPKVTSLTFGGENLETLYVTSAREHMSNEDIEKYRLSGSIFSIKTPIEGCFCDSYIGKFV